MKKGLLRKAGLLLSAALLAGMVQIPAFAATAYESDYTDKTATMDLTNGGDFSGYTYVKGYKGGLGGRAAEDYALINDMQGVTYGNTKELLGGFVVPFYNYSVGTTGTVRTLEMSMLYGGDADYMLLQAYYSAHPSAWQWNTLKNFVKVENGVVYAFDQDTGIRCNKDEWLRIVVEENYNAELCKFYINGQEIANPLTGFILGNRWVQANVGFKANTTGEGTRDAYLAIDDVKIYEASSYVPTGDEIVSYTVSDAVEYDKVNSSVYVKEGTPINTVLDAITSDYEYDVYTAHNNGTIISDTTKGASEGNVIIFKSDDGKSYDYLTITTIEPDRTISIDSMSASSGFENIGGNFTGGVETGLYGKAEDDYSFTFTLKEESKAATINVSDRNTYIPTVFSKSLHTGEDPFTTEFSIAAEGNFDSLAALANFTTARKDDGTAGDNAYVAPVIMNEKDGVTVNGRKIMEYKPNQWYRVAVTWYPQEFAVDVYVNGVEAAKKWVFVNEEYATNYKITGFPTPWSLSKFWFALQQNFSAGVEGDIDHVGSFSFDDTHVYYGAYKENEKNSAGIECEDYFIDEAAGEIYIEDGAVDVADLGDVLTITGDWSIYTDATLTEEAEDVQDGAVILVKSENGKVYKYYTIKSPEVSYGTISTTVNSEAGNILEDGAAIKAELSAYAPAYLNKAGILMLAVYKNGYLESVIPDAKAISGDTTYSVSAVIEKAEGMSAKAMFWDSISGMTPLVTEASFVELSE